MRPLEVVVVDVAADGLMQLDAICEVRNIDQVVKRTLTFELSNMLRHTKKKASRRGRPLLFRVARVLLLRVAGSAFLAFLHLLQLVFTALRTISGALD